MHTLYLYYVFFNRSEMVYFDSFGVEHVPEETKDFIGNENINALTSFDYKQTIQ